MATRFYLPSSGAAEVNPNYSAGWEDTSFADRIKMTRKTINNPTALTTRNITATTSPGITDTLTRQYVSSPIKAQVIEGTVALILGCIEDSIGNDAFLAVVIKVVSKDGTSERGTLFSNFANDIEFESSIQTRIINNQVLSRVVAQEGDRIVVEIGFNADVSSGDINSQRFGNSATSDFALTSGLTTDLNPWIQFSANIDPLFEPKKLRPAIFTPGIAR